MYRGPLSTTKHFYYSDLISKNRHNPRFLFDTDAKLTQKNTLNSSLFTAQTFFFFTFSAVK